MDFNEKLMNTNMSEDRIIRTATFNPKVCNYWLLSISIVFVATVIGIPLLLIWLPVGMYFTRKYLSRMSCELTEKTLKVNKGMWVRTEKTIPLEKITDLGMVQGPIMRHYDLHTLSIETAGQSGPAAALVALCGIVDAKDFREAVLKQRDCLREQGPKPVAPPAATGPETPVLNEIRDSLLRIEDLLKK